LDCRNRRSKRGTQVFLATHNPEIINETPLQNIYFFDISSPRVSIIRPTNEDNKTSAFRSILGNCGYCLLDQVIVFIEGKKSSLDIEIYQALTRSLSSKLKLIPVGDCENATSLNRATLGLLGRTINGVSFYSIRDRDYLSNDQVARMTNRFGNSVLLLPCHEVENLLIDFEAISETLKLPYFKRIAKSPEEIKNELIETAKDMSAEVVRDMAVFRMNRRLMPQDYSLGNAFSGCSLYVPEHLNNLKKAFLQKTQSVCSQVSDLLAPKSADDLFEQVYDEVMKSLLHPTSWTGVFPGKELICRFLRRLRYDDNMSRVFALHLSEYIGEHPLTDNVIKTLNWFKQSLTI
jgi:hypothetical protein